MATMTVDEVFAPWVHSEIRDGGGCSWCGAWAQVDEDCLCRECYEEDLPRCEWFALCGEVAYKARAHSTLEAVPTCPRCDAKAEALS